MAPISGVVRGVDFDRYEVVVFAYAGIYWVQPFANAPLTTIESKSGKWHTSTHLGSRYAALQVGLDYHPPSTTDTLPGVGKGVIAVVEVHARANARNDNLSYAQNVRN